MTVLRHDIADKIRKLLAKAKSVPVAPSRPRIHLGFPILVFSEFRGEGLN
jgi:hypothetical protein